MVNERDGTGEPFAGVPLPHAEAPVHPPRLLAHRPFLLLVVGDSFSHLGRWGFFLAVVGDATYRLDASAAQVGLLLASFAVPLIIVSPLYGSAADRWSAKWLLVATSVAAAATAVVALATESLGWLFATMVLYGIEHAAEAPARGALVPRLVGRDRLVQANGTISAAIALQLVVGPALASVLVDAVGRRGPYMVTVAAAALATVFFLMVPDRRAPEGTAEPSVLADVRAGFREAIAIDLLRRLFLIGVAVWFLVGFLIALEPSWVREELGRGQDFLGLVWAAYGVGEVAGSVTLARRKHAAGREPRYVAIGLLLAAVGFLVYVGVALPASAIAGNVIFGMGFPLFTASSYALIQRLARSPGKVTAAFSMAAESGPIIAAAALALVGGGFRIRGLLLGAGAAFTAVALVALRIARREVVR